jgi:hypothetical protein
MPRSSLLAAPLALSCLFGCAPPEPPATTDRVDLLLYTSACAPESEPPFENWIEAGSGLTIAWDVLCHRDDADTDWFAVKVTRWDDRSDDMWNVWYVEPTRRAVAYAEDELPGAQIPANPDAPLAQVRVPPRDLVPGEYRIEVWDVPANQLDATIGEAKLTVLGDVE